MESDLSTVISVEGSTATKVDTWMHIAAVADGINAKLYVDGVLDASTAYDGTINVNTTDLSFGRLRIVDTVYPLNGSIASVSLHDRALSDSEIMQLYSDPLSLIKPALSSRILRVPLTPSTAKRRIVIGDD